MSNLVPIPQNDPSDERAARFAGAVLTILEPLTSQERDRVLQIVTTKLRPISAPRAGEVLGAVILAFPLRREWSVEKLRESVLAQGVQATPKEVYNALGYLVRKGRIRRVGYGQYIIAGGGLRDEDRDDGTVRGSEHYS